LGLEGDTAFVKEMKPDAALSVVREGSISSIWIKEA